MQLSPLTSQIRFQESQGDGSFWHSFVSSFLLKLLPAYRCDLGDTTGSPTIWDYFLLHCIVVPSSMPTTCTAYIHKTEKDFIDSYKTMLRMASTLPKARPVLEANYDTAS